MDIVVSLGGGGGGNIVVSLGGGCGVYFRKWSMDEKIYVGISQHARIHTAITTTFISFCAISQYILSMLSVKPLFVNSACVEITSKSSF